MSCINYNPAFYLHSPSIESGTLDAYEVERAVAEHLRGMEGIEQVFTRRELMDGSMSKDVFARRLQRAFHPDRSGDVFPVQSEGWHLHPDPEFHAAMHSSAHDVDAHVALMVAGPSIAPAVIDRQVSTGNLVPSIASILQMDPPAAAEGAPLPEISSGEDL